MASVNNIRLIREAKGMSRLELAGKMGTSSQQVERLEKGQRGLTLAWIDKAADALNVEPAAIISPGALAGLPVVADRVALPPPANDDADTVEIAMLDVSYGMGGSFIDENSINVEMVKFSRSWLRQYTQSPPEMIFVAHGIGDSMMPTIHDTDGVVVDRADRVPRLRDKIWALVGSDNVGMIKRVRPRTDGTWTILSDNQQVPPDSVTDGEISVVGRVVAIVRKV